MNTNSHAHMMVGTFARLMLWLLILWSAVQLGAGLYEKQVVIPLWSQGATPTTLSDQLAASGHTASSTRFWPFVSPVVFGLAIGNLVVAWRYTGPARRWWLFASLTLLVMSISTYAYFVPTMLSMMHRADTYTPEQLSRTLTLWVNLSWLRSLIAVPAWLAAVKALTLLGGRPGWRL
ncbi:MAG: hypothetical protein WD534_16100 [Phycisphaeraceae bacterium]